MHPVMFLQTLGAGCPQLVTAGNLSNCEGNTNENATEQTNFTLLKLLYHYSSQLNLNNEAKLSRSCICKDGVQVQIEKENF